MGSRVSMKLSLARRIQRGGLTRMPRMAPMLGVALVLAASVGCRTEVPPPPRPLSDVWFDDLEGGGLALERGEAEILLRRADSALAGRMDAVPLPARLAADTAPRALFIAVSDGSGPGDVALGTGRGVGRALDHALARLEGEGAGRGRIRWLALDVVDQVAPRATVAPGGSLELAFGFEGVAFDRKTGLAFPAAEIVGRRLISRAGKLRRGRMARRARRRGLGHSKTVFAQRDGIGVRTFTAQRFFLDVDRGRAKELFRGHTRERAVPDERLGQAIAAGTDYLIRSVDARGRFAYSYLAKQGELEDEYNMVRHAGTIFAMVQAWEARRDVRLEAAIERAIGHMLEHVHPYGADPEAMSALAYAGKIKLGGVALAALALTTHARVSGSDRHLESARRLGRYLVAQQRPDGSFLHQRTHPGGEPLPFISEYYPGEAILALITLYQLDRDPIWSNAARSGARYLIQVRDRDLEIQQLTHDHWLLYGLERLYRESGDELFLEHGMRIAEAIVSAQLRAGPGLALDEVGGYKRPARSTPIATRNEGLLAAHAMALASGRGDMAARILEAVELGNEVLVSMQIDPARALYLEEPLRALGGVTRSHEHFGVRIDYVQHSLSSWLALLDARRPRR